MTLAGWHVLGLRMADRVGKGIRTSLRDALVVDCTPAEMRGLASQYQRAMDNAGAIAGPLMRAGLACLAAIVLLFVRCKQPGTSVI